MNWNNSRNRKMHKVKGEGKEEESGPESLYRDKSATTSPLWAELRR
jgi:hypothetical protein